MMGVEGGVCLMVAPDMAGDCDVLLKWGLEWDASKGEVFYR